MSKTRIEITQPINKTYMEAWLNIKHKQDKTQASINQYVSRVGRLMNFFNKDIMTLTESQIQYWIIEGNIGNVTHVRGFMIEMLKYNINNCRDRVSKDLLMYLVVNK